MLLRLVVSIVLVFGLVNRGLAASAEQRSSTGLSSSVAAAQQDIPQPMKNAISSAFDPLGKNAAKSTAPKYSLDALLNLPSALSNLPRVRAVSRPQVCSVPLKVYKAPSGTDFIIGVATSKNANPDPKIAQAPTAPACD